MMAVLTGTAMNPFTRRLVISPWEAYTIVGDVTMNTQILTAIIHREDDLYVAECPEVGTVSQGLSLEDAIANLKEATELYLEEFPLPNRSRTLFTTFEAACG